MKVPRLPICHWLVFALLPLFSLWNAWDVAVLMVPYATAANAPCIVTQRYNRPRLAGLAARGEAGRRRRKPAQTASSAPRGTSVRSA